MKRAEFELPPMGRWWQYVVPMFPQQPHHAAARVIQSRVREALCYRWSNQAKIRRAANTIIAACRPWIRKKLYRRQVESVVRSYFTKRSFDSRMRFLRANRRNGRTKQLGNLRSAVGSSRKVRVPTGFCSLCVDCGQVQAHLGDGKELLVSVNPKKLRVRNLYDDLSYLVKDDFTLCINDVPLLPSVFNKKLNAIGVCPGETYRVTFV